MPQHIHNTNRKYKLKKTAQQHKNTTTQYKSKTQIQKKTQKQKFKKLLKQKTKQTHQHNNTT